MTDLFPPVLEIVLIDDRYHACFRGVSRVDASTPDELVAALTPAVIREHRATALNTAHNNAPERTHAYPHRGRVAFGCVLVFVDYTAPDGGRLSCYRAQIARYSYLLS